MCVIAPARLSNKRKEKAFSYKTHAFAAALLTYVRMYLCRGNS